MGLAVGAAAIEAERAKCFKKCKAKNRRARRKATFQAIRAAAAKNSKFSSLADEYEEDDTESEYSDDDDSDDDYFSDADSWQRPGEGHLGALRGMYQNAFTDQASDELYNMDSYNDEMGPKSNRMTRRLEKEGLIKKDILGWSKPRIPSNIKDAPPCTTPWGSLSGFQPRWFGLFGMQQPCQVIKYPGIWFDKDGWYVKYYDLISGEFITQHLFTDPKIYQQSHESRLLDAFFGYKEFT